MYNVPRNIFHFPRDKIFLIFLLLLSGGGVMERITDKIDIDTVETKSNYEGDNTNEIIHKDKGIGKENEIVVWKLSRGGRRFGNKLRRFDQLSNKQYGETRKSLQVKPLNCSLVFNVFFFH